MAEIHALRDKAPAKAGTLSIQHVSKAFAIKGATLPVLEDVSLEIQPGEFVAIVGVSGCGKSTLLRLLSGLDSEYQGQLLHDGKPITGPDLERGLVFQDHRLFPWRTVYQNVALAFASTKVSKDERHRRVLEQISQVGLDGFADAYPHQLSGGMSQRAAIAPGLGAAPARPAAGRAAGRARRADAAAPAAGVAPPLAGGGHHHGDGDPRY